MGKIIMEKNYHCEFDKLEKDLEEDVANKLIEAGWEVKKQPKLFDKENKEMISPDMEILFEGKSFGYVDLYISKNKNPRFLLNKISIMKRILENANVKPLLLVLTDGFEYHISEKGKAFEMIHYIPSPQYYRNIFLINDYVEAVDDKERK